MLFGDQKYYNHPYGAYTFPTNQIAEIVFNDLKNQKPMTINEIHEGVDSGWYPGYPNFSINTKDEVWEDAWEKHSELVRKKAVEVADKFINKNKDCKFFTFEYSDKEASIVVAMEHGDLFDMFSHLKISHH